MRFETDQDRGREFAVAAKLEEAWERRLYKLPDSYILDFAVADRSDGLRGFVEVKCRNITWEDAERYGSLYMSGHKMLAAQTWNNLGFPTMFVYGLKDGIYASVARLDWEYKVVGTDRDGTTSRGVSPSHTDQVVTTEPVAMVPVGDLRRVEVDND